LLQAEKKEDYRDALTAEGMKDLEERSGLDFSRRIAAF
jgi:hypothetical protein